MSYRKKLSKGYSQGVYRKGMRVKDRNHAVPMRGGFRI